ncbi:MAG TPA: hypothetical protein VHJ19_13855 [Gammaproteobacteria bacterium]|nr:hypothetical protein [Gammaproteobacteria bacterium]
MIVLVGFSLGVEIGQLAIAALFVPLSFIPHRTWSYRRVVLASRPLAIALLTTAWMMERMSNFKALPI